MKNLKARNEVDIETSGWKDYKKVPVGKLSNLFGPKDFEKMEKEKPSLELKAIQIWKYQTR